MLKLNLEDSTQEGIFDFGIITIFIISRIKSPLISAVNLNKFPIKKIILL